MTTKQGKQNRGNTTPHPPTAARRLAMNGIADSRSTRDPYAITAPVDTTYRYRHTGQEEVRRSSHDVYAALVPYRSEEE